MPFLEKGLLQDPGLEHQVGVHPRQVEIIDGHLACHGVQRLVGVGEGVDEGLQGCPRELVEGVLHGVALGAGQDGVLQDVGDPRGVPGRRAEPHGKEVLAVVSMKVQDLRPRGEVLHLVGRAADVADGLDPADDEAVHVLPHPESRGRALCRFFHKHLDGLRLPCRRRRLTKRYWKSSEESRRSLRTGPARPADGRIGRKAPRRGREHAKHYEFVIDNPVY